MTTELHNIDGLSDAEMEMEAALAEGVRPADTQVTAALARKAHEIWGEAGECPEARELDEFLVRLAECYNALSPYNDYDLDIDI